jgi:hypothetical protein
LERNLKAARCKLATTDPIPSDAYEKMTVNAISAFDLKRDRSPKPDYDGVYFGDAADFQDIVNFWNLRAADIELVFFDPKYEARLKPYTSAYLSVLGSRITDSDDFSDRPGIWFKRGRKIKFEPFESEVITNEIRDDLWEEANLRPPLMYIKDQSALASSSQSGGVPTLSFDLRPKPFYEEPGFHVQNVVVSVRPLVFGDEENTFDFPFVPELNEFYRGEVYWGINEVRAERDGLGFVVPITRDHLTVHAIPVRKLIRKICEASGMRADLSEAGRIVLRLIRQMGGVQGCRVFKIPGVRNLIEKYSPAQHFERGEAIQIIRDVDPLTGISTFEQHEGLFIESREGGKLTPHQVFNFLLKQGVFRVGLSFLCPNCELKFWMHLDDIASEVTCDYCGQRFNATLQLKDRSWAYRRSGLFGREDSQQGANPVALTLQQIDTVVNPEMIYMSSMTFEPITAGIVSCESDFVLVSGKTYQTVVDVAVGECKAHGEITAEDVQKLTKLANAFVCKRLHSYIIFAKTAPFSQLEVERCRAAQSVGRNRVILLSDRELEPYFVYERTEKEFDIRLTAVSLENLAEATVDIYFRPKSARRSRVNL